MTTFLSLVVKPKYKGTLKPILENNGFNIVQIDASEECDTIKVSVDVWNNQHLKDALIATSTCYEKAMIIEQATVTPAQLLTATEYLINDVMPASVLIEIIPHHDEETCASLAQDTVWSWHLNDKNLKQIASYYSTSVAFYPLWQRFYNNALLIISILGLAVYISSSTSHTDTSDSTLLPFYSIFVILWSALFGVMWRRKAASFALENGTIGYEEEREMLEAERRPQFDGIPRRNPVTDLEELYFPAHKRLIRQVLGWVVTLLMLLVAVAVMVCSLNLQGYIPSIINTHGAGGVGDGEGEVEELFHVPVLHRLSEEGQIFDQNGYFFFIPPVLHAIAIAILNSIYCTIAENLTEWENWKTHGQFLDSLIAKRMLFESFDAYLPLFYLAFVRMDIGLLRAELVSLFLADEFRRVAVETLLPFGLLWFKGTHEENDKNKPIYESFDDYLEMVIQYGYIVLFASAYPLAPLISYLSNFVEIRSDLFKIQRIFRRPLPRKAASIGRFEPIIDLIGWVSIVTNSFIIGFSSDQFENWFPSLYTGEEGVGFEGVRSGSGRVIVLIIVAFEHLMVLLALFLKRAIPKMSTHVRERMERIKYMAVKEGEGVQDQKIQNMALKVSSGIEIEEQKKKKE